MRVEMTKVNSAAITNSEQTKNYPFPELQQFLQQIESQENSAFHQPYFANKHKVLSYKITFFLFGLLFLLLSSVIYFKNPNWLSYYLLMDGHFVKYLALSFSLSLSAAAFLLAFLTKTEHEVAAFIEKQAKRRLAKKYHLKCEGFCFFDSFPSGKEYSAKKSMRRIYVDTLATIHHSKCDYDVLLKRIAAVKSITKEEKEKLFNQTLMKFNDYVESALATFNTLQIQNSSH